MAATTGGNGLHQRWARLRESIASRLWPIPLAVVIVGVVLGVAIPELDRAVDQELPAGVTALLFSGGTDAARAVLSAIAGSLITAASLTFSLTVIALQLASSQASPRLLRMFSSDGVVHATLGLFLGTFAYSLAVLRTVADADDEPFVPRIAVTIASLLTLASVVMLTVFLGHLARQLRVETMMRDVHRETQRSVRLASSSRTATTSAPLVPDTGVEVVPAPRSGFITGIERETIVDIAMKHDIVVSELLTVGTNVIVGTALLEWWWRTPNGVRDRSAGQGIGERIAGAVSIGYERTPTQDIGFGLRQLVDIALRALSPGVNDPTTAVHALGHVSALLAEFDRMPPRSSTLADDHGEPRLVQHPVAFDDLLDIAMTQPRRYGASDPDVAARLYRMLEELAARVQRPERRSALAVQLERLDASVTDADYHEPEREQFAVMSARVRTALVR
jgi:uncharacterized membrane protein